MFFWIYYSRISLKQNWKIDCKEKHRNSKQFCLQNIVFAFIYFFFEWVWPEFHFFSLAQIKRSEIDVFSFYHLSCKNELRCHNQPASHLSKDEMLKFLLLMSTKLPLLKIIIIYYWFREIDARKTEHILKVFFCHFKTWVLVTSERVTF